MPPEVLEYKIKNSKFTALHLAVKYGNLKAAEMMVKKNQKLTQIRNSDGWVPLAYALAYTTGAQKEIVEYLYSVTNDEDPSPFLGHDGASLLCDAINQEFYDIASSLVHRFPALVSTKSKRSKQYGFEILVGKPSTFLSGAKLTWWQRCIYSLVQVDMDAVHGYDSQVDDKNAWEIDERDERENGKCSERTGSDEENPSQSIRANIEDAGNSSKSSDGIIGDEDHLSVGYKVPLSTSKDPSIIQSISILSMPYLMRALQMQHELQWFKGVESILLKKKRFSPNIDGDTAQSIFTEEHKDLVVKGEKWMKDTSGSCMVVATLIATVAFAAAFTNPGGNISDSNSSKNGTPVFLGSTSFIVFVVADALALFSSITSVLMFLALYTSRYAEEEFLTSLPRKLVMGLGTLFIWMATILVAFSAALSIALEDRCVWAPIPMALFSCVPVLLFVMLQLPLFVEIVRSAYWGSLFSKHRYVQSSVDKYDSIKKDN
ncbi:uncharacterized protein LOC113335811 [Papaver somniferum]|uniref:uncharacterized protein LOC113335811 n=1 Tax=Papaver somniferum TaxID=3469 RepID=UPI000E6F5FB2|nr:uncharacterized protein LOC113335811 [Papaver somniferum]